MKETQTIAGLENEIRGMEQAYENSEISKQQLKAGIADLKRKIRAKKLFFAKQNKTDEIRALKIAGKIQGLVYTRAIIQILNAKTVSEVQSINPQN